MFINREKELEHLEKEYAKEGFSFIPIYGRRRVGKTFLVKKYLEGKEGVYFLAREESYIQNLKRFSEKVLSIYPSFMFKVFNSFEQAFHYLESIGKKMIVVIDEFPYLVKSNKSVLNEIQYFIDETSPKNLKLVTVGSSISMMEKYVLSSLSPLYGRRTSQIKVLPFMFKNAYKMISKLINYKDIEFAVRIYGITDGIPFYINTVEMPFEKFIKEKVFNPTSILFNDGDLLLNYELRDPKVYKSILMTIAEGKHKFSEIINETGIQKTHLFSYLDTLIHLDIIKIEHPVTFPLKSKNRRYVFKDNYFNFYFTFIQKYLEEVQQHDYSFLHTFYDPYNTYLGKVFEDIAKQLLIDLKPINFNRIGKWWHKDKEIDIIAINEQTKEMLAVEVKWQDLKLRDVKSIIEGLQEKLPYVQWENDKRKEILGIFAKKVEKKAREWLVSNGYKVWDLEDIEKQSLI